MVENIIDKLNNELNKELFIVKTFDKKHTVRSLKKYLLVSKNNYKYLLEIAENSTENFYIQRSIEKQQEFSKINIDVVLNLPIIFSYGNQYSYVLYNYYDNLKEVNNKKPLELLNKLYQKNGLKIDINKESIDKILKSFLSAWPNQYHNFIRRQSEFKEYKKLIHK